MSMSLSMLREHIHLGLHTYNRVTQGMQNMANMAAHPGVIIHRHGLARP